MLVRPRPDVSAPVTTAVLHPSLFTAAATAAATCPAYTTVLFREGLSALRPVDAVVSPTPLRLPAPAAWAPVAPAPAIPRPRRPVTGVRRLLPILGPAFVAAIAYVDPGNFATNISGGATFGYMLVWVVVLANAVAMLVQYLSAKLGLATGHDLAQLCQQRLRGPGRWLMWAQAELVVMATDLAEFVGAAIALQLLFGLGPLAAGLVTAAVAFLVLSLRRHGRRPFEIAIIALLAVVTLVFGYELLHASPPPADVAAGLIPRLAGSESLLLASGIIGATVMPHAVYMHSSMTAGLTETRTDRVQLRQLLSAQRVDVLAALGIAGVVNVAMLVVAAALFHGHALEVASLQEAHAGLAAVAGAGAALAFAVALLASGLSSASVGTYAGEIVMRGYLDRRIPAWARRSITMLPALVLLGTGTHTAMALVLSQVVLSFGIPFTLVPLVLLTARRAVMGDLVNRAVTTAAGAVVAAAIIALNGFLIFQVVGARR
jgi:manganese transport protein